ncbi:hypothetical protein IMZ68_03290, partial [Candidatus Bathyarchaeota archaeon]|nr:hypothetical protein [Candidatus Bathyarchaeota archaeon]
ETVYALLLSFIQSNIETLREWIYPSASSSDPPFPKFEGDHLLLLEYIRDAEHDKPEHYSTLQDLILGSIISVVLYTEEPSEVVLMKPKEFKPCQLFLDTNFVFSLLELDPPEFSGPAKELVELLKTHSFTLKVFSFTVDEICRVISGYPNAADKYPTTIGVNTLYSSLKRMGWTKTTAREFIANAENILAREGIEIVWSDVNLSSYTPANEGLRDALRKYKPLQAPFYQSHDLAVIEEIRKLRQHVVRRVEESKALFLTSDGKLTAFDFFEVGHKENGTVCEVILDRLLASILWLKNPRAKLPLKTIVAAYSRDLFIDRRLWERFNEVLRQLYRNGEVREDNISMLFYHGFIEDTLREFDETEADQITPEFVLKEIEKATRVKEEEEAKLSERIQEQERQYFRQLQEAALDKEKAEQKWLEKIQQIKNALRESALRRSNLLSVVYASVLSALILVGSYILYWLFNRLRIHEYAAIILPLLFGSGGILGVFGKVRFSLRNLFFDRIYRQKLKEAKLDQDGNGTGTGQPI